MSSLVSAHKISMCLADGTMLFDDFNFSINQEKTGLVGKNGLGKTTLLRLITKEIEPKCGELIVAARVSYMPQKMNNFLLSSISDILNVDKKLIALANAEKGIATENDIEVIADEWNLKNEIDIILQQLRLDYLKLDRLGYTLSGGELVRILFAKVLLEKPDLILLDEPTNNLDSQAKIDFIEILSKSKAAMLIVSHDRELLNTMNKIIEISNLGLKTYGGNYNFYMEQRKIEDEAASRNIQCAEEKLNKQKILSQNVKDKQVHKSSHGEKRAEREGMSVIEIKSKIGSAQNTAAKLKQVHEERVIEAKNTLNAVKINLREQHLIQVDIEKSKTHQTKEMIICKNLNYRYSDFSNFLWKDNLNIEIIGNTRVALSGRNGSGKTTLIKLFTRELKKAVGEMKIGSKNIAVLDQKFSLLNEELSILENMQKFSLPDMKIHEIRIRAGRFLFYGETVFKKVKDLSGGERLRVALACLLATSNAPDIFILDEPTNNLDLDSINILTNSLNKYTGTIIVISHDKYFLKDIKIERTIYLERNRNAN